MKMKDKTVIKYQPDVNSLKLVTNPNLDRKEFVLTSTRFVGYRKI